MVNSKIEILIKVRDEATRALKKLNKTTVSFSSKMKSLAKTVLPFVGITAGILLARRAFISAVSGAMEFEKAMSNIATLVDTNIESMSEMSKQVLRMSKRMPISINDLTQALYQVRSAGISAADAMFVLESSGRLAVAGLGTTEEAVNLLTSTINVFSRQGYSANEMSNILFKTIKAGKTTVAELAQSFGMVAPIAGEMGVKLTELSAATAALTTTGMKASIAQSQIRASIAALLQVTPELQKLFDKLAVSTGRELIATYGLVGGMKALKDATEGNDKMLKKAIGSIEGLNAVLFLAGVGSEKYIEILADMESGVDSLTEAFDKQTETSAAQYQMLKNRLSVVMIDLGKRVLPFLIEAFRILVNVVEYTKVGFETFINRMSKGALVLGAFGAALTFNEKAFNTFYDAGKIADEEMQNLADEFANTQNELNLLKEGLGEYVEAANGASGATEDYTKSLNDAKKAAEKAFEEQIKVVKELRVEITGLYKDMAEVIEDFTNESADNQADYYDEVADLVVEAENDITDLEQRRVIAIEKANDSEIVSLNKQIAEKQNILATYQSWNLEIDNQVAERRKFHAMNELEQLQYNYQKKELMRAIEYLKSQIDIQTKINDTKTYLDTIQEMIGAQKMEEINAEIRSTLSFKEQLRKRINGLMAWTTNARQIYSNFVLDVNAVLSTIKIPGLSLPGFAQGGVVPGPIGAPQLAVVHGGETIIPTNMGIGGRTINITITGNTFMSDRDAAEEIGNMIIETLKNNVKI